MTAFILDGRTFVAQMRAAADVVVHLKAEHGVIPGLAVVLAGEDPASHIYVRNKGKQTVAVGIECFETKLPYNITEA
ncbi:tetrahydrofolate dehydrogenase/cyclohydrolase catalytic domain-containing protein [Phyllobacterium sp. YR531]|uniref:tetrahydrofolate dehydrogenase/cyclohydrolase catalytic domain-containing protein n=1 Tax=Phyllobacterium sp. YR531 TaxID=1144343 RepID=UPI00026FCB99|nr:tetrahydrofolate dehydrogenase/cyclohydrolase catalytic domain-containing protein [Phyllobacterium sp. YR531]EJN06827.1 5,10-methylene-tetrahydrofolate dehydrogenase/methenyl tetrahydrofolate cyclohydrolase [Phyllobacterium sp. YR531]